MSEGFKTSLNNIGETVKLRIPSVMNTSDAAEYVRLMLRVYKDVHLDLKDIEVQTSPDWMFYKVSIFRWSKCSFGCGSKEHRESLWESHQQSIKELFELQGTTNITWRFVNDRKYHIIEIESKDGRIPGIELCILKEIKS